MFRCLFGGQRANLIPQPRRLFVVLRVDGLAQLMLQRIVDNEIPRLYELVDEFINAFRFQWHWINKPFGWEVQDIRLGGVKQRLITTSERLQQYIDGEVDVLEELEQPDLPLACRENLTKTNNIWKKSATRAVTSH